MTQTLLSADLTDRAVRVILAWAPLLDPDQAETLARDILSTLSERATP
jgi:hypothetical protein